jgi:large subunit ribosomal protein LP0
MTTGTSRERKEITFSRARRLFATYDSFAMVGLSNVMSTQLKNIKAQFTDDMEFLVGKHTSIIRAIKSLDRPDLEAIVDFIKGDVNFVFFKRDIKKLKAIIEDNVRYALAKVGEISQCDVWIESRVTGMTSEKTSFFQVLGIATKITGGKIEIISPYKVLSAGGKVGPSQANLLSLLDIKPFTYRMKILKVYEKGLLYDASVLDIGEEDVKDSIRSAVTDLAALSLGLGIPTKASVPYEIRNAFRDILSVSFGSGFAIREQAIVTGN